MAETDDIQRSFIDWVVLMPVDNVLKIEHFGDLATIADFTQSR
ncbi:MAG: hypothetical protein ACLQJR_06490 [Stellaceae bacterium]